MTRAPLDPLDPFSLPESDLPDEQKQSYPSCATCLHFRTCLPRQQAVAMLGILGLGTVQTKSGGKAKLGLPKAALLPMACGGNAYEATVSAPPRQAVAMFEDYVPRVRLSDFGPDEPGLEHTGDQGLPI